MWKSLPRRTHRVLNSVAYTALVALVAGLGYLTLRAVTERRANTLSAEPVSESPMPLLEFRSFSSRRDWIGDSQRLHVSVRLRLTAPGTIDCYLFVLARNDHVEPKLWALWPADAATVALSAGGHFRASSPTAGQFATLTHSWSRVAAQFDHLPGRPSFDTVVVYVVSPKGEILFERPFAL